LCLNKAWPRGRPRRWLAALSAAHDLVSPLRLKGELREHPGSGGRVVIKAIARRPCAIECGAPLSVFTMTILARDHWYGLTSDEPFRATSFLNLSAELGEERKNSAPVVSSADRGVADDRGR
jgi:hypothetical protein